MITILALAVAIGGLICFAEGRNPDNKARHKHLDAEARARDKKLSNKSWGFKCPKSNAVDLQWVKWQKQNNVGISGQLKQKFKEARGSFPWF